MQTTSRKIDEISHIRSKLIGSAALHTFTYCGEERHVWELALASNFVLVAVLLKSLKPVGLAINQSLRSKQSGFLLEYADVISAPSDPSLVQLMQPELLVNATAKLRASRPAPVANWNSARSYLNAGRAVRVTVPEEDRPTIPTTPTAVARFKLQGVFCGRSSVDSVGACFWRRACQWAKCVDDAVSSGADLSTACKSEKDRALECFGLDPIHG